MEKSEQETSRLFFKKKNNPKRLDLHTCETSQSSQVDSLEAAEALPRIVEEQGSPSKKTESALDATKLEQEKLQKICVCKQNDEEVRIAPSHVAEILKEKEIELRDEYEKILEREKTIMKDRFDFILLNEQIRASYMLREAHRERQEKIHALQTQLQCKNLAALMYVMCTERRRSRMEKLKIIEDYTKYINELHDILKRGQELILYLSRGYKTAARVDHEWREKMKKVIYEFMAFIYHYAGGDPETNQYLIDLPKLMKTETTTEINPEEDPCDSSDDEEDLYYEPPSPREEKPWWDNMDNEEHPFVMYGDMADFNPDQRREVLKQVGAQRIRAAKTAPKEWKELVFDEMFSKSNCPRLNQIKNIYPDKMPIPIKWECIHSLYNGEKANSKMSLPMTARNASLDIRGTMGSILKIIAAPATVPVIAKTELLGARDSMEITSTTRLKNSAKPEKESELGEPIRHEPAVVLNIGKKRPSVFAEKGSETDSAVEQLFISLNGGGNHLMTSSALARSGTHESTPPSLHQADDFRDETQSLLGSLHQDSLMIQTHHQEQDHSINYERVCPMEKCQRMQVDSFMRTLPPYMRANPFTHFEQTFDQYETCTPEQLEMIKQRIDNKKKKEEEDKEENEDSLKSSLSEWASTGVGVQTSATDMLPPCTCQEESLTSYSDSHFVFDLADLEPVKVAMDAIHRECLFSDKIDFNRFKVIGQDLENRKRKQQLDNEFKETRYQEIAEILNKHPSLLDIFQANAQ